MNLCYTILSRYGYILLCLLVCGLLLQPVAAVEAVQDSKSLSWTMTANNGVLDCYKVKKDGSLDTGTLLLNAEAFVDVYEDEEGNTFPIVKFLKRTKYIETIAIVTYKCDIIDVNLPGSFLKVKRVRNTYIAAPKPPDIDAIMKTTEFGVVMKTLDLVVDVNVNAMKAQSDVNIYDVLFDVYLGTGKCAEIAFYLYGLFAIIIVICGMFKMLNLIPFIWVFVNLFMFYFKYNNDFSIISFLIVTIRVMLMNYSPANQGEFRFYTAAMYEVGAAAFLYIICSTSSVIILVGSVGGFCLMVGLFYGLGAGISKNLPDYMVRLLLFLYLFEIVYVMLIIIPVKLTFIEDALVKRFFSGTVALITWNVDMFTRGVKIYAGVGITKRILQGETFDVEDEAVKLIIRYCVMNGLIMMIIIGMFFFFIGTILSNDKRFKMRNLKIGYIFEKIYFGALLFMFNWNPFVVVEGLYGMLMSCLVLFKWYSILLNPLSAFIYAIIFVLVNVAYMFFGSPISDASKIYYESVMIKKNKIIRMERIAEIIKNNMVKIKSIVDNEVVEGVGILIDNETILTVDHVVAEKKEIYVNDDKVAIEDFRVDTGKKDFDSLCVMKTDKKLSFVNPKNVELSGFISDSLYGRLPKENEIVEVKVKSFDADLITVTSNTWPGDSGTPFFNESGQLVGLHCGSLDGENYLLPLWRMKESDLLKSVGRLKPPNRMFSYFDGRMRAWSGTANVKRLRNE